MTAVPQPILVRPQTHVLGRNGLLDKYFYFSMSLLVAAIVVWGFSHTIDTTLLHPAVTPPFLLWIHAAAFSTWVVFFILQSALVRTHHVRMHRSLGWFGAALGTVMFPLGITTAIVTARFDTVRLHQPVADAFLIEPFFDMLAFGVCFGLAVLWRKKPEFHRRLIFIATCVLLDAAFARIDYLFNHNLFFLCLDAVILLGVARDLLVNRRIHVVYRVALPMLMVSQAFVNYTWRDASGWWVSIAHSILG
jgi:FtsH-binding integral membrane protein